jgi:hypothetical protein|tara:strand:+ start:360 stop:692 length:333 start_codon:yes stop_codon:yes gene_type:complete
MGWKDIIKRHSTSMSGRDKEMIRYVMNDGSARTLDSIMDDIYTEIKITRKLNSDKRNKLKDELGRPSNTRFNATKNMIRVFLQESPDYEEGKKGKDEFGQTIFEFRYIGG